MGLRLPGPLSSATIQVISLKFYLNQKPARSSSPLPVLSRMEQRVRESHCARDRRLPLYPARSFSATALKRGAAYHASPPFSIVRSSAIFARGAILFHLFIKPAMLIFELLTEFIDLGLHTTIGRIDFFEHLLRARHTTGQKHFWPGHLAKHLQLGVNGAQIIE